MKKVIGLSLAAAILALVPQQAHAWKNIQFGVGMNLNWQSGGNNFAWGLYQNGQVPPPPGYFGGAPAPFYPDAGQMMPPDAGHPIPHGNFEHAQSGPPSPFHYSSYQQPSYYYGQNNWHGGW